MPDINFYGTGTTLSYSTNLVTPSYTLLAQVTDATFPNQKVDAYENTAYDSPGNRKTFLSGWVDSGDASVDINFLHTQSQALLNLLGTTCLWKIVVPDPAGSYPCLFQGFIQDWSGDLKNKGPVTIKLKIKVTGVVTLS